MILVWRFFHLLTEGTDLELKIMDLEICLLIVPIQMLRGHVWVRWATLHNEQLSFYLQIIAHIPVINL